MLSVPSTPPHRVAGYLPVAALVFNALVWGTSWWPFRRLESHGLHPLWATAMIFVLAAVVIAALRPRALGQVLRTPALWVLVAASGTTKRRSNWAVVTATCPRRVVVLPDAALDRVSRARAARRAVHQKRRCASRRCRRGDRALARRCRRRGRAPLRAACADGLGRSAASRSRSQRDAAAEAARPEEVCARDVHRRRDRGGDACERPCDAGRRGVAAAGSGGLGRTCSRTGVLSFGKLALQYGRARLPANRTAVVMLTEVLFAAVWPLPSAARC